MPRARKTVAVQVRLTAEEKATFDRAADIAGAKLASWIRQRLRAASLRELDRVGEQAAFLFAPTASHTKIHPE